MDSPVEPVSPPSGDEMRFFDLSWRSKDKAQDVHTPPSTSASASTMEPQLIKEQDTPLLTLPSEILHQILAFLECPSLVSLSRTSRQLRIAAFEDLLWQDLLRQHIPPCDFPDSPYPSNTYRDLFITHHPYWFVPRNRIWISDDPHIGRVMLCKYDSRRGCIEGYRLLAERGPSQSMLWPHKPTVLIHTFSPNVHLWLDDPVLKLPHDIVPFNTKQGWWEGEIRMSVGRPGHNTSASFFLSRNLPSSALHASMEIWPPRTIPNMPRVRSASIDKFRGRGHKPQKYEEISQTTFRMRHWSQFASGMSTFGVRVGEEVSTWSTLDPKLYTPTKAKPYQGIFVGDYAGHGCEFLLVMQTDKAPPIPERGDWSRFAQYSLDGNPADEREEEEEAETQTPDNDGFAQPLTPMQRLLLQHNTVTMQVPQSQPQLNSAPPPTTKKTSPAQPKAPQGPIPDDAAIYDDESVFRGALEAVKLTGDPNVPRGEHTFIADDIGSDGFIRNAMEKPFCGSRVVKSRGHVAARGFVHDEFIPSQLFLINHDRLAQYWLPFGHISFYERVDIDELMEGTFGCRRASS